MKQIDELCKLLTDMCIESANLCLPKVNSRKVIPGWNDSINELKQSSLLWGKIWKDNGRPTDGVVADVYRKSRRDYHNAIKSMQSQDALVRRKRMAECLATNDSRDLWGI